MSGEEFSRRTIWKMLRRSLMGRLWMTLARTVYLSHMGNVIMSRSIVVCVSGRQKKIRISNDPDSRVLCARMPTFYLRDETHTLASALREQLESAHADKYVTCTVLHPLDKHVVVEAPSENDVRSALLRIKDDIRTARLDLRS